LWTVVAPVDGELEHGGHLAGRVQAQAGAPYCEREPSAPATFAPGLGHWRGFSSKTSHASKSSRAKFDDLTDAPKLPARVAESSVA